MDIQGSDPDEPIGSTTSQHTVLVIDDDELVLNVTRRTLERAGYRVLTAADGTDGLRMATTHHQELSVVLLDQYMPKQQGRDVIHELRQLKIHTPIILSSGVEDQANQREQHHPDAVLHKPYRPHVLLAMIQHLLP